MNNEEIKEVEWTDDAIRWHGGLDGDIISNNDEENSYDGCVIDPFADPSPTEIQTIKCSATIEVHIKCYKMEADAVWKSTGLALWRASHYLCQYQVENSLELFRNKRVIELGAGLGLNGLVAWKIMCELSSECDTQDEMHSGSVCITDGDTDALVILRENIQRNQSPCQNSKPQITAHQLLWGASTSQEFLAHITQNQKYETIIASDIIYALSIVVPLWETIQTLLETDGVFVMAYARREVPVSIELVLKEATRFGFVYELVKEDQEDGIWVYEFRFA